MVLMTTSDLPLKLVARGKVRDVYEVEGDRLVAGGHRPGQRLRRGDGRADPMKGAVLTQVSAWWFRQLGNVPKHHMIAADADEIVAAVPALKPHRAAIAGRAMLCRRGAVFPSNAWSAAISPARRGASIRRAAVAGDKLPAGLKESDRLDPPIFSPATKAESGHDENITVSRMREILGAEVTASSNG